MRIDALISWHKPAPSSQGKREGKHDHNETNTQANVNLMIISQTHHSLAPFDTRAHLHTLTRTMRKPKQTNLHTNVLDS